MPNTKNNNGATKMVLGPKIDCARASRVQAVRPLQVEMIVFKNCGAKCAGKRADENGSYIGDPRGRSAVLVSLVPYDKVKEKTND